MKIPPHLASCKPIVTPLSAVTTVASLSFSSHSLSLTCHESKEMTQVRTEALQLYPLQVSVAKTPEKPVLNLERFLVKPDPLVLARAVVDHKFLCQTPGRQERKTD